jgi:hypothetical protein
MNHNNLIRIISILLLIFSFNLQFSNAQPLSIQWDKEQPYHKRGETTMIDVIKSDEQFIFYKVISTKITKNKEFIVKNNRKTGEDKVFDILDDTKGSDFMFTTIKLDNGGLQINSDIHHSKKDVVDKYQQMIDTASMLIKSDRAKLNTVADTEQSSLKYLAENFEMYGNKMIFIWKKDKEGNTYSINRKFENKKDKKKFINSVVSLVYYPKNNGKPTYLPLILPNNCFISSYQLSINDKGEIVCAGLYAKEGLQSAMGCYSFVVSPMLSEIKSVSVKEFSKELLTKGLDSKESQAITENIAKSKEFEDNTMYLSSEIHYNKDGSYNVAIEKYKLELEINQRLVTTINHHYYSDIYVLSCNSNGSIKWMQKIPRFASVVDNASFSGMYFLKYDDSDNMNFIFNLIQTNKISDSISKSRTVWIKLDNDGNEKFSEIESDTEVSKYICPKFFSEYGSNSIIVVKYNYNTTIPGIGSSKNTITFGELKLK